MKQIWPKKEDKKPLVFSDVRIGQLFIDRDGWLCGKKGRSSYVFIANEEGLPNFGSVAIGDAETREIKEIIPEITKLGIVELSDD